MKDGDTYKTAFARHFDSFIAAVAAFLIIYEATRNEQFSITPDSVVYLNAARNIYYHHTFTSFNGNPLVDFPFFYPFFLSIVLAVTHLDVLAFASILNAFLFALTVFLSGIIIQRTGALKRPYKWFILLLIISSPSLLQVYTSLWSETLFIVEVLSFFIAWQWHKETNNKKSIFISGLLAGLACITRYVGITLVGLGLLLIVLDKNTHRVKKWKNASLFALSGLWMLAVNMIRNKWVSHTLTGPRLKGHSGINRNVYYYGRVIEEWMPFTRNWPALCPLLGYAFVLSALSFYVCRHFKKKVLFPFEEIITGFIVVYSLFFLIISSVLQFEQIDNRFLAPLFIPIVISTAIFLSLLARHRHGIWKSYLVYLSLGLWIILFLGQLVKDKNIHNVFDSGFSSYTDSSWRHSEVAKFLHLNPNTFEKNYTIYSNEHDAVYFFSGLAADRLPQKTNKPEINDFVDQDSIYVIWFKKVHTNDMIDTSFILSHKSMKTVLHFSDGVVYQSVDDE